MSEDPMKFFFILLCGLVLALSPMACQKSYNLGPQAPSAAQATPTPAFTCGFVFTPVNACQDTYDTPTPTWPPCPASAPPPERIQ